MTANYKADGWLGVLTSALIYIDFPNLGFDKAYQELKHQIELFRMNDSSSIVNVIPKPLPTIIISKELRPVV